MIGARTVLAYQGNKRTSAAESVLNPAGLLMLTPVYCCLVQVHLGLLEGRVTHVLWPPSRFGRVAVQEEPGRLLSTQDKES